MKAKNTSPFRACWKAGVPLISLDTADPAQSVRNCIFGLNGKGNDIPLLEWDCVQGLRGTNLPGQPCQLGAEAAALIAGAERDPATLINPVELLALANSQMPDPTDPRKGPVLKIPARSILFMHNMHKELNEPPVFQALWNCRDSFKALPAMIVLMGPSFQLPPELAMDVISISEDLPNDAEIEEIVNDTLGNADMKPDCIAPIRRQVIDTLRGLAPFAVEQTTAMSLVPGGIDLDALWQRKVRVIEQTPGLTVWRGTDTLADIAGIENAKNEMAQTMAGKLNLTCVVFIDEGDKVFSPAGQGDSSGTNQDQNKVLLTYLEDKQQIGCMFHGPPGTCKTQLAKSLAGQFKVPLIMFDLGGMKSRYVGDSEANIRAAIKIIESISSGRALWIVAMNGYTESPLPPELIRRFNYHSFFFDLPTAGELPAIWALWQKKFNLRPDQCDTVNDYGWTGAEVRNCCRKAWAQDITCSQAARTITPVSRKASGMIDAMRKRAHMEYTSASYPGDYIYNQGASLKAEVAPVAAGRKFSV